MPHGALGSSDLIELVALDADPPLLLPHHLAALMPRRRPPLEEQGDAFARGIQHPRRRPGPDFANRVSLEVADALVDAFLDIGVVPMVLQSDLGREFVNDVPTESTQLLGSTQLFSSAVHPQ